MSEKVTTQMKDTEKLWQDPGIAERYANAENATRPFAKILMEKAGLSQLDKPAHVFDLATGTGAAIQELYDAVPKEKWGDLKVLGGDVSKDMIEYLQARGEKEGWTGLETRVLNGNVRLFFTSTSPIPFPFPFPFLS
jgi:ubiquinone/menaquinone biosynthesis C-methylase UbiE